MNHRTLEERILTVLLLGSATSAELARMLVVDRFTVAHAIESLASHRMVHAVGSTSQRWPKKKWPAVCHDLTQAGRAYAEELIK